MDVKNFCNNPTPDNFKKIGENYKDILYGLAQYCMDNDKGDIEIARKIIRYYKGNKLSDDSARGVKALLLGLRLQIKIYNETNTSVKLKVYTDDKKSGTFSIWYNKDLPELFLIKVSSTHEIDKELSLYLMDAIDFFIDFTWKYNIVINRIIIRVKELKLFYTKNDGVYWGQENCIKCKKIFKKYGINCTDKTCDYNNALKKLRKLYLKLHPDKPGGNRRKFEKLHECQTLVIDDRCFDSIKYSKKK